MSLITPNSNCGMSDHDSEDKCVCSIKRTRAELLSSRDEDQSWEDSTDDGNCKLR